MRVRLSGREGLPELLLLLRGVQRRRLEERTGPPGPVGSGRVLARLLPHLLPAVQHRVLGGIPLPLTRHDGTVRREESIRRLKNGNTQ